MSRKVLFGIAVVGLFLMTYGLPRTPAQQKPLEGVVTGEGFTRIKIAIPVRAGDPRSRDDAREIATTLRDDLVFSGFFDVIDPSLYNLVPKAPAGTVPHDDWLSIGADAVVLSEVTRAGDRVDLVARLHDNPSRTLLFGRRYGGRADLLRRIAHQLADDLVRHYTGRSGIALTRIAFVSKHGDGRELYLMDYDGHRVRRLTTTSTINLNPAWDPSGDRIAFVSWLKGQPGVYVMSSEGKVTDVATLGSSLNAAPDWSPDGKRLVYASHLEGNAELILLDLDTRRNTRLTRTPAIEISPAFSPNGREIAFTSDRSGTPQIYVMDAEGLNVRRLTFDGSYNDSAAWSPRGDRIAYASRIDGRFDILVLELATGARRRLTNGQGNSENPRWSPDGRHIVFASNRSGIYDIYTMSADGRDVTRLTRGIDSVTPDWSR